MQCAREHEVERGYWQYYGITDDDVDHPIDVTIDVLENVDDVFEKDELLKEMVSHPLERTIFQLLPKIWHGFQGKFPVPGPILETL